LAPSSANPLTPVASVVIGAIALILDVLGIGPAFENLNALAFILSIVGFFIGCDVDFSAEGATPFYRVTAAVGIGLGAAGILYEVAT
jgi:hypothetical protein